MTEKFELILSTESKVLTTNIADFEKQADAFISTLTSNFETDDDFLAAKEEVKILKELEDKTRLAIKNAVGGDIKKLVETAESIAERFRQERLARDKLVKIKESEIKAKIIDDAVAEISDIRHKLAKTSDISLALEENIPKHKIASRIEESTKRKSSISGLTKAVNAEKTLIISEITIEVTRLTERLEQLTAKSSYLFPDAIKLIASEDDLAPIIKQRIDDEQKRELEIKAKAQEEAKVKAETQAVQSSCKEKNMGSETLKAQELSPGDAVEHFEVRIAFSGTLNDAVSFARKIKEQYGDNVTLKKIN